GLVPPDGGRLSPQVHLIEALVFFLLMPNVLSYQRLISPHRRNEISTRPEVLTDEISLPLSIHPRYVDRALALDEPHHLRHRILRWHRYHHVHMIWQQMSFLDLALLLTRQLLEHLPKVPTQLSIQYLAPILRYENYVVFALPLRVA